MSSVMTSILIAPSAGWVDDTGVWSSGARVGHMCESELSHKVAEELQEELDTARLRAATLPTVRHPGLSPIERLQRVEPGMVLIGIAFPAGTPGKTAGRVHYGTDASLPLAELMTEGLGMWGKAYCGGYEARRPKRTVEPMLTVPDTLALVIEPFSLEQAGAETLATRARALAQSLSWGLQEFFRGKPHAVHRPGIYRGRCYG